MLHVRYKEGEVEHHHILAWHGRKGYKDQAGHPWEVNFEVGTARSAHHPGPSYGGFHFTVVALEAEPLTRW